MEEEVGIKVTRLRRRLSVEAEDVKSPSTQSTPTKKRGGRLAAKPQLELIDENVPETAPKRTRKSISRDIAEPVDDKVLTPSRRSTRIRSNTSIVSETAVEPEEKGTPARRNTRVKSNASIAEPVASANTPRAKRAARRTSQVGSDNEAPVTPARQTRRTRKDSASSVDKTVEPTAGKGSQITEVIVEETKIDSPKSESPSLRKSPRLVGKTGRISSSPHNDNKENRPQKDKETILTNTDVSASQSVTETNDDQTTKDVEQKVSEKINLSAASSNLIKEIDDAPKKGKLNMNKSTNAITEEPQLKSKRNRTKSWTTISIEPSNDNSFCSDSEVFKKKNKKKNQSLNSSNISGSGDGIMNTSNKNIEGNEERADIKQSPKNSSILSDKKNKKRHEKSIMDTETAEDVTVSNTSVKLNKSTVQTEDSNLTHDISKGAQSLNSSKVYNSTAKLFEQAPSGLIQSLVYIEDSDSNNGSIGKGTVDKEDGGDQCVPVVDHNLGGDETAKEEPNNMSYEPMDIDETMPENVSLSTFGEKNNSIRCEDTEPESQKRKSIFNISQVKDNSIIKSKRNSSISNLVSVDTIDGSPNTSNRESLEKDLNNDSILKKANKSKRKSSLSIIEDIKTIDNDANKSLISDTVSDKSLNDGSNKSLRKSLATNTVTEISMTEGSNNSKRKSSISKMVEEVSENKNTSTSQENDLVYDDNINKSLNKSKKSITAMVTEVSVDKRTSSISDCANDDIMNKSSNKSKRKSILNKDNDDTLDKSSNKSKRKSSILNVETETHDKTENENKSTLIFSQIKVTSQSDQNEETNVPKNTSASNEQLSKSINIPTINIEKETDKNNVSLTYKTSTPLQQKSIKKLGMQINSSIIAPNSVSKTEKKNTVNNSKKDASILSQENESDSSKEEDSEEESSMEKSKFIEDEAGEASDDYESGDSRDEEEKEYEEQHEIVEKGETLDSDEDEYSDDSDYEKDSFIVSSDEEDNDLLSGSGDDLDMSANELSMSTKSKNKYNARKIKEQKKASKEMYEARHQLNKSDKSGHSEPKPKKNNRARLDSSSSDSDEEVAAQPKNKRRQRIDSSQDITAQSEADKSVSKKKKKSRRLSESVCEDEAANEKEMSICEDIETGKIDPLTLKNAVKVEPKTPQKDLNISTVAVIGMEDAEEVNVDENVSIMDSNQTSDPLQTTVAQNDAKGDEDSISENEEITNNYASVLSSLNKANSKKNKSMDISLNLNKKTKQKAKKPIIDQLNLTQVKDVKKNKATQNEVEPETSDKSLNDKSIDKEEKQVNIFSEGSSDSIDMKLLFTEDSNDSESVVVQVSGNSKNLEANATQKEEDVLEAHEDFIPLKRSEGKTNMLENIDKADNSMNESLLNVSNKKKNKRKSSATGETDTMIDQENETVNFFVDTTGNHSEDNKIDVNTSINNSAKKNKQKYNVSFVDNEETKIDDDSNDTPLEVSYKSNKDKSKQELNTTQTVETKVNTTSTETPSQSAKKNKKGLNSSQNVMENSLIVNTVSEEPNTSAIIVEGSAKKKKRASAVSQLGQEPENDAATCQVQNVSLGSAKKLKNRTVSESATVEKEVEDYSDVINEDNSKKRKRKSSANQTIEEILVKDDLKPDTAKTLNDSTSNNNQKKKRKISHGEGDQTQIQDIVTETQEKAPVKISKKKNKEPQRQKVDEIYDEATKKNKKRKNRDEDDAGKISKILKQNSFDKVHVPRLPANVLKQLDDKPKTDILETKKAKVVSTTSFLVEETRKRRNKPSNYLEESVYLNDSLEETRQKGSLKKPKVLPFLPTASTSDKGFTTNFRVNIVPQQTQFIAQSSDISNFKNDYLHKKRIKKLGTFEMYKKQRNIKISKF